MTATQLNQVPPRRAMDGRQFAYALGAITLAALVWRVIYILVWRQDHPVWGDAFFYHEGAHLLADGEGFVNPFRYIINGVSEQAADHPPVYTVYLSAFSWLGWRSPTAHMLATALVGSGSVLLSGLIGRRVAGWAVGLLAALLVAFYPNTFSWDGMLAAESIALFIVMATVLVAYRAIEVPSIGRIAALGALVGLAALARAELALLAPLLVVPIVLRRGRRDWRRRLLALGASGAACLAVLAPWVGYNLTRFDQPVLLSSGGEFTLATVSCDRTWYGELTGYWSLECPMGYLDAEGLNPDNSDESQRNAVLREESLAFIGDNLDRLPIVLVARVARGFGVWDWSQGLDLDSFEAGRDRWVAVSGAVTFLALLPFAVAGAVRLRRRKVPVYPLALPLLVVLIGALVTFGQVRYRAIAEGPFAVLAAVGLAWSWVALTGRWRNRTSPAPTDVPTDTDTDPAGGAPQTGTDPGSVPTTTEVP